MPRIPSPSDGYTTSSQIPFVFQVLSPDMETLLLPDFMVLNVNPSSMDMSYSKAKSVMSTRGGFVEQHFGDQLTGISSSASTGAFLNAERGVTTFKRTDTVAYRKFLQLVSLFKSNGSVYDERGVVQFNGRIRMIFGGGIFDGFFKTFDLNEAADKPYEFNLSWSFSVTKEARSLLY